MDRYEQILEDIAAWIEDCARAGHLSDRLTMADQLRSGDWRTMAPRRGAPQDVVIERARRKRISDHPLRALEARLLDGLDERRQARIDADQRSMDRLVDHLAATRQAP